MSSNGVESLEKCVLTVKRLSRDIPHNTLKQQADLFVAFLALLVHLKADQATLQASWKQQQIQDDAVQCPTVEKIPAASAVVQDPRFFHALIQCLRAPKHADNLESSNENSMQSIMQRQTAGPNSMGVSLKSRATPQPSTSSQGPGGRKRSQSFADELGPANKTLKLHHSPKPMGNAKFKLMHQQHQNEGEKLLYNIRVTAATVLYSGLQHVDHWPAPLVRAYAEDCSGPRFWVDDERCSLLVKNLALTHKKKGTNGQNDLNDETREDANKVAKFYISYKPDDIGLEANENEKASVGMLPLQRNSSTGSQNLTSLDSISRGSQMPSSFESNSIDNGTPTSSKKSVAIMNDDGDSSDSDSGDEEILVEVTTGTVPSSLENIKKPQSTVDSVPKNNIPSRPGGDDSSSSGEEDMEVVETANSIVNSTGGGSSTEQRPTPSPKSLSPQPPSKPLFPFQQKSLNLTRVRQRYFASNLTEAHQAISDSISDRLDTKSKQNSRLLSHLPSFTSIPEVRRLVARHLERWMQSPALSGLARTLFAATVGQMRHVDPPLPADIDAIDSILSMRLKANQLNAHIENVTSIAKNIPTASVAHHIFLRLLREELASIESAGGSTAPHSSQHSEHLRMVAAISGAISAELTFDGIAGALLTLQANPTDEKVTNKIVLTRQERHALVRKLRELIRRVAFVLGREKFDGCRLVESLLSFGVDPVSWSIDDEEDKARLMFECMTLLVPPRADAAETQKRRKMQGELDTIENKASLRQKLRMARKLMLSWCCTDYAPLYEERERRKEIAREQATATPKLKHMVSRVEEKALNGAGTPCYESVLDGKPKNSRVQSSLGVMRCVLFLLPPDSPEIYYFLYPDYPQGKEDPSWYEERYNIQKCCEYGTDLDDEMIWIILRTAALPNAEMRPKTALILIEYLVECCRVKGTASLKVKDPKLVWDIYNLVEYKPSVPVQTHPPDSEDDTMDMDDNENLAQNVLSKYTKNNDTRQTQTKETSVPRLAYPGMWWRVTVLALIMCSASPDKIGAIMWKEHPTLQALIKMVTSNRYRFPTVDCDKQERDDMKASESELRDEESKVTEMLFLPKPTEPKNASKKSEETPSYRGSRISIRQREKQERALKQQREKEAAAALVAANRRRKLIRAAQKSIMLLDPRRAARKPPRESVDLILSAEEMFDLEKIFQKSIDPDFLLMTIGQTSRQSIERAYEWLIPVISSLPNIISRLPSSASCFLLLRAYGGEGDESSDLRKLSSPLLQHVKNSLAGEFGESNAIRAADLLLADVADQTPDRRRCARKVLQEALSEISVEGGSEDLSSTGNSTWLFSMIRLQHAPAFISDSIKYISRALAFERGKVLRVMLLALKRYIDFAKEKNVEGTWNFAAIVYTLISGRHNVCFEVMDRFPDFRDLAVTVIHDELKSYQNQTSMDFEIENETGVRFVPCKVTEGTIENGKPTELVIPSNLLNAVCVLFSNWRDSDEKDDADKVSRTSVYKMTDLFIISSDKTEAPRDDGDMAGLASATFVRSGKKAVSVEQWVMLAKSRSDFLARRAALTAPTIILPRLLLCSGLPRSSLLTMIDRLGKLGDHAPDQSKVFNQLLMPSATTDWGIGHLGNRRELARKLLGRLSAYLRVKQDILKGEDAENMSMTFLQWLSRECHSQDRTRKSRQKKGLKVNSSKHLLNVSAASSILSKFEIGNDGQNAAVTQMTLPLENDEPAVFAKDQVQRRDKDTKNGIGKADEDIESLIERYCETSAFLLLEGWLQNLFDDITSKQPERPSAKVVCAPSNVHFTKFVNVSVHLLEAHLKRPVQHDYMTRIVLKWVPVLTESNGSSTLWGVLFDSLWDKCPSQDVWDQLLSRCLQYWRQSHISSCHAWILTEGLEDSDLCPTRLVRFLAMTSAHHSVHIRPLTPAFEFEKYTLSKEGGSVSAGVSLAIECMKQKGDLEIDSTVDARNDFPNWLVLILLLARRGKNEMERVIEIILKSVPEEKGGTRRLMSSTLLRLYAYYPLSVKLGNAKLRSLLVEATETLAVDWIDWRTPLDEQVSDMLNTLKVNPHQRLVQALGELSKGHPLLVLRKLPMLVDILEEDATYVSPSSNGISQQDTSTTTRRGRVQAEDLVGAAIAKLNGCIVKVVVRHWGYSLSEPLWVSITEILLVIPREVLFVCGLRMGLVDLLNVYIRLMHIQSQLQNRDKPSKLKARLQELLSTFQSSNSEAWIKFVGRKLPGLPNQGTTKDLISSCNLLSSPPQPMETE